LYSTSAPNLLFLWRDGCLFHISGYLHLVTVTMDLESQFCVNSSIWFILISSFACLDKDTFVFHNGFISSTYQGIIKMTAFAFSLSTVFPYAHLFGLLDNQTCTVSNFSQICKSHFYFTVHYYLKVIHALLSLSPESLSTFQKNENFNLV
jgi:hypothetical protein